MSSQVSITGGNFQDPEGNPLASGYLLLVLSQDAQVDSQEIVAGKSITVSLDSDGSVVSGTTAWPNDVLSPANTFYAVSAYTAEGQLVWGPNSQQVLSTPSPYDIGAWIPGAVNVLNPGGNITGLIEAGTNVTITGSGTGSSPYSIASSGGGGGGVTSFNTRTGAVTLDSSDVTTALTYTPVNKAGDTMTGLLVLSANPTANLGAATKQYVDSSSGTAITALTGDVTASGPGSAAASVVKVNGAAVPASHAYAGTNSSGQIIAATTPLLPANNLSDVPTPATARTNLGLGTMATQNANTVSVTGGTINGASVGATTPAAANVTSLTAGSGIIGTAAAFISTGKLLVGASTAQTLEVQGTNTGNSRSAFTFSGNFGGSLTSNWEFGVDYLQTGSKDFYIYNYGTSSAPVAIAPTGAITLGGAVGVTGTMTAAKLATTQTPTASSTASDHSIPIVVNGTTYYMRLSSTP